MMSHLLRRYVKSQRIEAPSNSGTLETWVINHLSKQNSLCSRSLTLLTSHISDKQRSGAIPGCDRVPRRGTRCSQSQTGQPSPEPGADFLTSAGFHTPGPPRRSAARERRNYTPVSIPEKNWKFRYIILTFSSIFVQARIQAVTIK